MGKKGTWFSAVKKAFRSPSKDKDSSRTVPKDPDLVGNLPAVDVPVSSFNFPRVMDSRIHVSSHHDKRKTGLVLGCLSWNPRPVRLVRMLSVLVSPLEHQFEHAVLSMCRIFVLDSICEHSVLLSM